MPSLMAWLPCPTNMAFVPSKTQVLFDAISSSECNKLSPHLHLYKSFLSFKIHLKSHIYHEFFCYVLICVPPEEVEVPSIYECDLIWK